MATAYVTGNSNDETATSSSISVTVTASAGDLIAVAVAWGGETATLSSVSDGTSYTLVENPTTATGYGRAAGAYLANVSSGSHTITATLSTSTSDRRIIAHVISGAATLDVLDDSSAFWDTIGGGTDNVSFNLTPSQTGDYLFGCDFNFGQNGAVTAGTGYNQRYQLSNNKGVSVDIESYGSTGNKAVLFTDGSFDQHLAVGMAFKVSSGSGVSIPVIMHNLQQQGIR